MKKIISSIIGLSSIVFVSNVQAKGLSSINPMVNSNDLAEPGTVFEGLVNAPMHSTAILVIAGLIGVYFAIKHHEFAKKHQELHSKRLG